MKKLILSVALLALLVLLTACVPGGDVSPLENPAFPGEVVPGLDDPTNINTVLLWLMAGGAAPTIALLFGKWKWFNALTDNALKHTMIIGAVIGVPLLAKVLLDLVPATAWAVIQPYWSVAVGALLIGYPLSQMTFLHYIKPEREEREWEVERAAAIAAIDDEELL